MAKRNKTETNQTASETKPVTNVQPIDAKAVKYVVVRDGFRVSDKEYDDVNDTSALLEREFWNEVEQKHSFGAPVQIVQYDSKKHRIW